MMSPGPGGPGGGMAAAMQDKLGGAAPPPPAAGPAPDSTNASDQAMMQDFLTSDSPDAQQLIGVVQALCRAELSEGPEDEAPAPPPPGGPGGPGATPTPPPGA